MSNLTTIDSQIPHHNLAQLAMDVSTRLELQNLKTSTDEAKGIAILSGEKDNKTYSVTIQANQFGVTQIATEYSKPAKKTDLMPEVKRLYKDGYKQKEIATILGISQTTVSNLINS
ncbi:helix-turn-helix domain-containing protein [Selenomonas sp. KH1T6]|uniref:helix-turn-helix domain-containing protein n=1 Tax=Selenomonas sp. KH1T6 TaxID=3158784 RepID=UPI0008A74E00|nr:Homeodomain-like domain-containing protein [Selenomonas ruminantium]